MSEPTPDPAATATTTANVTDPKAAAQGDPADKPLGEGGEKALKAEREARAKAEKELGLVNAKLSELEQANLSDLEKAQKAAQAAQEQALKAGTEALRYRIAADSGISGTTTLADGSVVNVVDLVLTAPDEATMRQQAALWAARTPTTSAGPRPDLTQGGSGGAPSSDPAQQFAEFIRTKRAG